MKRNKIAGLLIIFFTLTSLGIWELWGRENFAYDKVLVLKSSVDGNTAITKSMVEIKRIEKTDKETLKPKDIQEIIGKESSHFIPADTELFPEYFQNPSFQVGENTGRFVLSVPEEWLISYPQTMKRGDRAFFYCGGEIVIDATVAYVRDGSNQEVHYGDKERLESSAKVSLIEIIVDRDQMRKMGKLADKGNKFVILYN